MKFDVFRNARRNVAAFGVLNTVKTVLPFVNRTLFLWFMGSEYLGLNGLFSSVIAVLSLAEMGFGQAVVGSLHKPVAEDDRALVCAYLKEYRTIYRFIGAGIFAAGLCLLPFVPSFVRGAVPPDVNLRALYLVHLASTASSYFVYAYRGPILGAHQREDVSSKVRTAVLLLQYAVCIPIVVFLRNYLLYVLAGAAFTIAGNVLVMVAAKRLFPWAVPRGTLPPALRRKLFSDAKAILVHRMGWMMTHQSNGLVLSALVDLSAVAAYGNYLYVTTTVAAFVGSFNAAMSAGFGNTLHTEGDSTAFALLLKANRVLLALVSWAAALMLALYQPFMEVWTKGDPALARHFATPLLMVAWFVLQQSRTMLQSFKAAAVIWREDRWKPVVGGVADLSLNVALVSCLPEAWKLDGVVISTIVVVVLIQIPWETRVVFAKHFGRRALLRFFRQQASFAVFAAALCAATLGVASFVPDGGCGRLLAKGCVAAAFSGAVVLPVFGRELAAVLFGARGRKRELP